MSPLAFGWAYTLTVDLALLAGVGGAVTCSPWPGCTVAVAGMLREM
jgi:hypothetical protein